MTDKNATITSPDGTSAELPVLNGTDHGKLQERHHVHRWR